MPKSKISRKILFRDFAKQDKKYINNNYLKNLKVLKSKYSEKLEMDFINENLQSIYDELYTTLDGSPFEKFEQIKNDIGYYFIVISKL